MSDNLVLEAKSVSKFFGTITALQNVDLHLNKGEVLGVVGDNGAGKSTILDALTFALFGKPFRTINKAQLINSINTSGLVVEVETDFFSHAVAASMDRVWVRWFDPALGIMEAEAWPSTALTRP